jgi:hypothetical protein
MRHSAKAVRWEVNCVRSPAARRYPTLRGPLTLYMACACHVQRDQARYNCMGGLSAQKNKSCNP